MWRFRCKPDRHGPENECLASRDREVTKKKRRLWMYHFCSAHEFLGECERLQAQRAGCFNKDTCSAQRRRVGRRSKGGEYLR
jgi:hypothetical protein